MVMKISSLIERHLRGRMIAEGGKNMKTKKNKNPTAMTRPPPLMCENMKRKVRKNGK